MDTIQPNLRKMICCETSNEEGGRTFVHVPDESSTIEGQDKDCWLVTFFWKYLKNGFAPRAALLTGPVGRQTIRRKAPTLLVFGSGAYVHRSYCRKSSDDFSPLSFQV